MSGAGLRFIVGPTLALSALLAWQAATFSPSTPPLTRAVPALDCTQPPAFRVDYEREAGGVEPAEEGWRFNGEGWVRADACTPGTLTLRAQGIRGGDDLPRLRIGLNSEVVFDQPFDAARTVRVRIPQAGRITVGYFNDYYRAEARVAQLTRWQFAGRACTSFKIDVPPETGGGWQPELNAASLVWNVPMTLTPCSAGQLSLRLSGRAGDGIFPLIVVKQQGAEIGRVRTSAAAQNVSFTVSAAPVSLNLANPYFKELADRNVMVPELTFTPDGR